MPLGQGPDRGACRHPRTAWLTSAPKSNWRRSPWVRYRPSHNIPGLARSQHFAAPRARTCPPPNGQCCPHRCPPLGCQSSGFAPANLRYTRQSSRWWSSSRRRAKSRPIWRWCPPCQRQWHLASRCAGTNLGSQSRRPPALTPACGCIRVRQHPRRTSPRWTAR